MARARKRTKKFEFKGFVNLEFTLDEKTEILNWVEAFGETPIDALSAIVEGGYKVSCGWDNYHGISQINLTCNEASSSYYGYCFTMKHQDIGRALLVLRWFYDAQLKTELYRLDELRGDYDW